MQCNMDSKCAKEGVFFHLASHYMGDLTTENIRKQKVVCCYMYKEAGEDIYHFFQSLCQHFFCKEKKQALH